MTLVAFIRFALAFSVVGISVRLAQAGGGRWSVCHPRQHRKALMLV
jgi:hypothetical protein